MANDATVTISATILPDEIAKTISGTMTVTPADVSEKWYFKKTSVTTTSTDLIAGNYIDYTAIAVGSGMEAVASGDQVKFLLVQNQSSSDGIMLSIDAGTAAYNLADGIYIGPSETWFGRLPSVTVADLHAISSDLDGAGDASATCLVAALLHDVSI